MKPDIVHSVAVCLAALALPFMAACSSQEASLPDETSETSMFLNVEQIGQTRSSIADLYDNEKMHSLRVVVLHPDGTVEHNRHYSWEGGETHKYIMLKVKSGEKKKVFLFANEESVTAVKGATDNGSTPSLSSFFDGYAEGGSDPGDFADKVNNLYFAPDYVAQDGSFKPIPMSSMYEIEVKEKENFNGTFYIVRVATKFVVKFLNWRGSEVAVDYVGLESHAVENYLMAHVEDSERNKSLFNGLTWIDWLKEVSEASTEYDKASDDFAWLTDYELPGTENNTAVYTSPAGVTVPAVVDANTPGTEEYMFYIPESKNLTANDKQEYVLIIHITDTNAGRLECPLTGLNALFRNTEVVVNVELGNYYINVGVDVTPYKSVSLEPEFGLPVNTNTTP